MALRRSSTLLLLLRLATVAALSSFLPAMADPGTQPPAKTADPAKAAAKAASPKAPAADPNVAEKEFSVTIASGAKIKVQVYPNLKWPGKVLKFDPYFPRTDANMHSVALNAMWEIYGRQRGSFQPTDATVSSRAGIGAIVVYALRTGSKFCVYPISSDEKGTTLAMMKVWME